MTISTYSCVSYLLPTMSVTNELSFNMFFTNSAKKALEFLENQEEMFPSYYMYTNVFDMSKYSTKH